MIVTFQSKASGDVIMFGDVAYRLMQIMGKRAEAQGIVTVEQLPEAIRLLKAAVAEDKAAHDALLHAEQDDDPRIEKTVNGGERPYISLTQRAIPLLELLDYSMKKGVPVVWGV